MFLVEDITMKYKFLSRDYSSEVVRLRKKYIDEMLEKCLSGHEMFQSFLSGFLCIGKESEEEFGELVFRVKSVFPTSNVKDISDEIMEKIVEKESKWAMSWAAYTEKEKARKIYEASEKELEDRLADTG